MTDNSKITIVTAFYALGREGWQGFERSDDVYYERFTRLARLKNDMIVYVANQENKDRVLKVRNQVCPGGRTEVVIYDFMEDQKDVYEKIQNILDNPEYKSKVPVKLHQNPEYWNGWYVLVNLVKTYVVRDSIQKGLVKDKLVAWVDFGVAREDDYFENLDEWKYDFPQNKVNVYNVRKYKYFPRLKTEEDTHRLMYENDNYIIGTAFVSGQAKMVEYCNYFQEAVQYLLAKGITDDDQGIMMYLFWKYPRMHKLHFLGKPKRPGWPLEGIFQRVNQNKRGYKFREKIRRLFGK
ncbi:hypothetical protein CKF54_05455 [Psittacicella hinzii]|uniref:Protein YibB n=1 Tax=Psittacicella hinzii TaxID=2028575 RepID=A0A3A1Y393_9GAMM|nr:WlaTC/HtrL family glycosyltransferase [Psittacicella hinzii]RIY32035.1 hypothetical protein CKF54_05455 [Psittacicella hinzii]